MLRYVIFFAVLFSLSTSDAQSEKALIEATLNDYLEGTSLAKPEQIRRAFHEELNLYSVNNEGQLSVWKGSEYIDGYVGSKPSNRLGKILQIDYEKNAAIAKIEIYYPQNPQTAYIDYFMLLKLENKWTIIHKIYTKK